MKHQSLGKKTSPITLGASTQEITSLFIYDIPSSKILAPPIRIISFSLIISEYSIALFIAFEKDYSQMTAMTGASVILDGNNVY